MHTKGWTWVGFICGTVSLAGEKGGLKTVVGEECGHQIK